MLRTLLTLPTYELTDSFEVAASPAETWAFFSAASNLPAITPPWLAFRILTPEPVVIGQDSVLDYTIRWMGLTIPWRTLIIDWQPPGRFIDLQLVGPYVLWHHQHDFVATPRGTTRCRDRVLYKVPGGPLGPIGHELMVRRQLMEIFRFRRGAIRSALGWKRALQRDVSIRRVG